MSSGNNNNYCVPTISETVTDSDDKSEKGSREEDPSRDDDKKKSKKFTCKQKVALVMLATVDFMSFCSMSIMAPFYPQEAANKGMTEAMAGFVFGFYALVVFLSSPVFGKVLPKLGIKLLFIGGVLVSGICNVIFGVLNLIDDYTLFTTFSFLIRGMEALGASAYSTASYVIIVNIFPDNAGAVRGLLETFVGLGMSVGPAIGGFLFAIGGFGLPFYVIGVVVIVLAPLNILLLPATEKCAIESKTGSLLNLLKLPTELVICFIIIVVAMTWGFLDPTLEPHLRKFHLSPGNIGLIFLLESAAYGISSPFWGWVTDKLQNYWWLMTVGLFINSLSLLFLGPSSILSFIEDSVWLNVVSLSVLGTSVAMALMPAYQALLDTALESGFEDNLGTHSVIAGLWSSVYSLGEVLGPVLGGTLMQHFGFSVTSTCFLFLNITVAILATIYFSLNKPKQLTLLHETPVIEKIKNANGEIKSVWTEKIDNGKLV